MLIFLGIDLIVGNRMNLSKQCGVDSPSMVEIASEIGCSLATYPVYRGRAWQRTVMHTYDTGKRYNPESRRTDSSVISAVLAQDSTQGATHYPGDIQDLKTSR